MMQSSYNILHEMYSVESKQAQIPLSEETQIYMDNIRA